MSLIQNGYACIIPTPNRGDIDTENGALLSYSLGIYATKDQCCVCPSGNDHLYHLTRSLNERIIGGKYASISLNLDPCEGKSVVLDHLGIDTNILIYAKVECGIAAISLDANTYHQFKVFFIDVGNHDCMEEGQQIIHANEEQLNQVWFKSLSNNLSTMITLSIIGT